MKSLDIFAMVCLLLTLASTSFAADAVPAEVAELSMGKHEWDGLLNSETTTILLARQRCQLLTWISWCLIYQAVGRKPGRENEQAIHAHDMPGLERGCD